MFLGIEIGGTKLQLAVAGAPGQEMLSHVRFEINPARGAAGILDQIERAAAALIRRYAPRAIGVGFGGPVDSTRGVVLTSHQIEGWNEVPLGEWCRSTFGLPTRVGNDCDSAALAEALYGAGRGEGSVFYVTVGTGVGGGLVLGGKLHGENRPAVAEIGHLRPGPQALAPDDTVESVASGWGIAAEAVARMTGAVSRPLAHVRREPALRGEALRRQLALVAEADREFAADLAARCNHHPECLTAKMVAQAAAEGNDLAREVLERALQVLGWAIAQTITLVAPTCVVVGGGVSLLGEAQFFEPLRHYVAQYVFPPLASGYALKPAALGELVVVHGALELARAASGAQ